MSTPLIGTGNLLQVAPSFIIYGLIDPRDGQLRYIGKTERDLAVRLNHHVHRAVHQKTNTYKANWVKSVLGDGLRPEIVELERCDGPEELVEAEQWHIAYWRNLGCRLTNLTAGGEGASGYRHSTEARRKMSMAKKGCPGPWAGHRHSEATKVKIAKAKGVRPFLDQEGRLFSSQTEAARFHGLTQSEISAVLRGLRGHARGHVFKYVE